MTARRHHRRAATLAPRRKRRRHTRRNPGGPYGSVAIATVVGLAAYCATQALGYFTTKDGVTNAPRNRGIVGVAGTVAGLALAKKSPLVGVGLAAGSLLGAFSGWLTLKLFAILPAKKPATTTTTAPTTTSAVYADNMAAYVPMSAVYADNMAAVYADNMAGYAQIGNYVPQQPWAVPSPF